MCFFAGLVDAQVESKNIPELLQELVDAPWDNADLNATAQKVINHFALPAAVSELSGYAPVLASVSHSLL